MKMSAEDLNDLEKKILLVEIVSCRELLAADSNGFSDPYVLFKMGSKTLHKTEKVTKKLNPVYTSEHNNMFLLDCSVNELFVEEGGVLVEVMDWDRGFGNDDELGSVFVSAKSLYKCKKKEYRLDPPPGKNENAGYVTIQTSEITESERDSVKNGTPISKVAEDLVLSSSEEVC